MTDELKKKIEAINKIREEAMKNFKPSELIIEIAKKYADPKKYKEQFKRDKYEK